MGEEVREKFSRRGWRRISFRPQLHRVVEILIEQMDPARVLTMQVKRWANQTIQTPVPRVIGLTSKSKQKAERGI